jgi:hypothetical protein
LETLRLDDMVCGDSANISSLSSLNNLKTLLINYCEDIHGDLSCFSGMNQLTKLQILRCENIEGELSKLVNHSPNIKNLSFDSISLHGDIAALSVLSNHLEELVLINVGGGFEGDIGVLSGLSKLKHLKIEDIPLSGNISSLSSLSKVLTISIRYCEDLEGDLSTLNLLSQLNALDISDCPLIISLKKNMKI